ncbi:hypothetical protein FXN61_40275, partial [Lentzea sp. PSKA42]
MPPNPPPSSLLDPREGIVQADITASFTGFQRALGVPATEPPEELLHAEGFTPLELHCLALDAAITGEAAQTLEDACAHLSRLELAHWRTTVSDAGLGFADDKITLALALALPALFPVGDQLGVLLDALPAFNAKKYDLRRTAEILSDVFPLEPIAYELAQEALSAYGEPDRGADVLVDALRAVAPSDRQRAVEVLCRLSDVPDDIAAQAADMALSQALTSDPDGFLPAAALATNSMNSTRLVELLELAFPAASYEVAVEAYLSLPRHDSPHAPAAARIALDLFTRNSSEASQPAPEHTTSALLDLDLATRMLDAQRPDEAAAFAQRAAENADTEPVRARSLIILSRAVAVLGHARDARDWADEAVAIARPLGDDVLLTDALQTVVAGNHAVKDYHRAAAASLEAVELTRKGSAEDHAIALSLACAAHTDAGEPERAAEFAA